MTEASPQIIVIAGPNGAGKSTLAPFLLRDTFGLMEYINADTIAQGLSAFAPESVAFEAGRVMLRRLHDLAKQRGSFAFETTLASRFYAPWIAGLRQRGYGFNLMFLWLRSSELAVQRVRGRVRMGGHNVPESVIRRRYIKGVRNFFDLYQALADSWGVYDNSSPGEPKFVAKGSGSSVTEIFIEDTWQQLVRQVNESRT